MDHQISPSELENQLDQLLGQPVSHFVNAYAFVLYFEIGKISRKQITTPSGKHIYEVERGEWTISVEGDWKFWKKERLFIDSRSEERYTLDPKLETLSQHKLCIKKIEYNDNFTSCTFDFGDSIKLTVQIEPNDEYREEWCLNNFEQDIWYSIKPTGIFKQDNRKKLPFNSAEIILE